MTQTEQKQYAHEMMDRLDAGQFDAVVRLLQVMTDPVVRAIADAPIEDEPISEEEARAVEASKAWLKTHEGIPNEEVLAEFGLTAEDFERMGRTPLPPDRRRRRQRLQNVEPPELRLRVGNYRVRFHDLGDSIMILAVKHRREAYR